MSVCGVCVEMCTRLCVCGGGVHAVWCVLVCGDVCVWCDVFVCEVRLCVCVGGVCGMCVCGGGVHACVGVCVW